MVALVVVGATVVVGAAVVVVALVVVGAIVVVVVAGGAVRLVVLACFTRFPFASYTTLLTG